MSSRSISNLSIIIAADTKEAMASLDGLIKKVGQTKSGIDRISGMVGGAAGRLFGGKIGGFGGLVGGLFGGPVGALGGVVGGTAIDKSLGLIGWAIKTGAGRVSEAVTEIVAAGADYELNLTVFQNALGGSEEKAKSLMGGLNNLATGTIFTSQTLAEQARRLLGAGVAADNVIPTLTKLALIAQRTGQGEEGLERVAYAFTQIRAAGRLTGMELRQLNEVGIGTKQLADTLGMTAEQFTDMVHAGQISFGMLAKAMNILGTAAEGEAEKINKTFTGRLNSLKDIFMQSMEKIGFIVIKAFNLSGVLGDIASFIKDLPRQFERLTPILENISRLIAPIAKGLYSGFMSGIQAGKNLFDNFTSSMTGNLNTAHGIGQAIAYAMGTAVNLAIQFAEYIIGAAEALIDAAEQMGVKLPPGPKQKKALENYNREVDNLRKMQISMGLGTDQNIFFPENIKSNAQITSSEGIPRAGVNDLLTNQQIQTLFDQYMKVQTADKLLQMSKGGFLGDMRLALSQAGQVDHAKKALEKFAAGFPNLPPLETQFDKTGIATGPQGASGAAKELARKINEGFQEGKIGGPVRDFMTKMANLREAERFNMIARPEAANQFIANEFANLTRDFKHTASQLPRAVELNTVQGQQEFERIMMNLQDQQKDVPGLLKDILRQSQMQVKAADKTVDELRKFLNNMPIPVGGF